MDVCMSKSVSKAYGRLLCSQPKAIKCCPRLLLIRDFALISRSDGREKRYQKNEPSKEARANNIIST
jgi:hypothetical protein